MSVYRCTSPRHMPIEYGYIDPHAPIDSLSGKLINNQGRALHKKELYHFKLLGDTPIELAPGLSRNGSALSIGAMPSIHIENSVLISFSYVTQDISAILLPFRIDSNLL